MSVSSVSSVRESGASCGASSHMSIKKNSAPENKPLKATSQQKVKDTMSTQTDTHGEETLRRLATMYQTSRRGYKITKTSGHLAPNAKQVALKKTTRQHVRKERTERETNLPQRGHFFTREPRSGVCVCVCGVCACVCVFLSLL